MTDVAFHTGVPDLVPHACRLLRKAVRSGVRIAVFGPPALLDALDSALWTFEPLEFIPHLGSPGGAANAARLARTPVVLVRDGGVEAGAFDVGLGIDPAQALDVGAFARVIELVGTAPAQQQSARQRWRAYVQAGSEPRHVAVGEPAANR